MVTRVESNAMNYVELRDSSEVNDFRQLEIMSHFFLMFQAGKNWQSMNSGMIQRCTKTQKITVCPLLSSSLPPVWTTVPSPRTWPELHQVSVKIVKGLTEVTPPVLQLKLRTTECAVRSPSTLRSPGNAIWDGPPSLRSSNTTVSMCVTTVCIDAIPAFWTRTSHLPGGGDDTLVPDLFSAAGGPRLITINSSCTTIRNSGNGLRDAILSVSG